MATRLPGRGRRRAAPDAWTLRSLLVRRPHRRARAGRADPRPLRDSRRRRVVPVEPGGGSRRPARGLGRDAIGSTSASVRSRASPARRATAAPSGRATRSTSRSTSRARPTATSRTTVARASAARPVMVLERALGPMLPADEFDDPAALARDFDTLRRSRRGARPFPRTARARDACRCGDARAGTARGGTPRRAGRRAVLRRSLPAQAGLSGDAADGCARPPRGHARRRAARA